MPLVRAGVDGRIPQVAGSGVIQLVSVDDGRAAPDAWPGRSVTPFSGF